MVYTFANLEVVLIKRIDCAIGGSHWLGIPAYFRLCVELSAMEPVVVRPGTRVERASVKLPMEMCCNLKLVQGK